MLASFVSSPPPPARASASASALPAPSPARSQSDDEAANITPAADGTRLRPHPVGITQKVAHKGVTGAVRVAVRSLGGDVGLRRSMEFHGLPQRSNPPSRSSSVATSVSSASLGLGRAATAGSRAAQSSAGQSSGQAPVLPSEL